MTEEPEIWLLQDHELAEALRLSTQAGWNQTLADWDNLLSRGLCLGGRLNGRLVSTGTLVDYVEGAWLGMLLVDEEFRNHGFGSRMLNVLLKAADEKLKLQWVGLDATDLGRPMYLKRGFRDVGFINRWAIRPAIFPQPLEAREFVDEDDAHDVEKLDEEAFDRGRRWSVALDSHFIVCNDDDQQLLGFGRSRPGRLGPYIGPVAARSVPAAISIVAQLILQYLNHNQCFIDVPKGNPIEPWLKNIGARVVRSWTRMLRGKSEALNCELIFAIAGPELG